MIGNVKKPTSNHNKMALGVSVFISYIFCKYKEIIEQSCKKTRKNLYVVSLFRSRNKRTTFDGGKRLMESEAENRVE
ncbi:hypothetical protein HMPREF0645_0932 [Hallella bergensis DSM 17361]|uniref:Uncharacterized protein n=1 Tax=Hallella bergensis DSM 17361 TaxID=585502 RepID=D1PVE7_9BACT|nr:hypothetical protein [Hallella bergensis]EFA44664.1 hypothetical protein HMPREF0645_0932 [Hallella bergensis DSM 17361]